MRDGRKTRIQSLGTNAEREVETQGILRAILDFEAQLGLTEEAIEKAGSLIMIRGDGASIAATQRLRNYLCAHPTDYRSFRTCLPPGPEVWHTIATRLNSLCVNFYGPNASSDPSAFSASATAANVKRPADLTKCDFYPTARSVKMFWTSRVLDIWRSV